MPCDGPSRRDLLAALLGMPAALAGCALRRHHPLPPGEIVGASAGVGHRLREAPPPRPAHWERAGVVIVGAGIAGLAAAWRFRKAGFTDFLVLELEPAAGGNARSGRSAISAFPWGAHYIPAPLPENRLIVSLLEEMGMLEGRDADGVPIVAEQYLCRDPQERIFYLGRWYEGLYLSAGASDDDLSQWRAFQKEIDRWAAWRDGRGRRAFTIPVAACSDDAVVTALDRQSMTDWLDGQGWHSPRLRWLVDYACRDDYGTHADETSAWAGLFYFASRRRKPGADGQPFVTWPEGNGRLARYLAEPVRERTRLGMVVADLKPAGHGQSGVEVTAFNAANGSVLGFHAERVVFAAPHFLTRHVIAPYRARPPDHVAEFEYAPWMVANISLSDRPRDRGFPLAWDNVLYESPSLGYVVATHQTDRDRGPTVLTYYYPLCDASSRAARTQLLAMDWQACAELTLADLSRAHPDIDRLAERLDVMRWGHAMIRPKPGFIWGQARAQARQPFHGIHFAHSDLSGVSLFEEAFYHGVRAAEEVLAARGQPVRSLL